MVYSDNSIRFDELKNYMDAMPSKKGKLIHVLHKAQGIYGYLSEDALTFIAETMELPISKVYGVVSFYSFFSLQPKGEYDINVCLGTVCYIKGAEKIMVEFEKQLEIHRGETTADKKFSLGSLRCVGACGLAPVVLINKKVYGCVQLEDVSRIIQDYKNMRDPADATQAEVCHEN